MSRTLVVGDIHGALKALDQVMERAFVTTADQLIFLGDYVDGWSESAGVVSRLMQLAAQQDCIFIKGNHDVWCEEWLRTGGTNPTWLAHGGNETLQSYGAVDAAERKAHLDFLEQMPYYFIDAERRLFIHAGFTSMRGPEHEFERPVFSWDRTLWETALGLDQTIEKDSPYYPKRLRLFEEIYIGHTPTIHYYQVTVPMLAANVWNMDTGAAFHGKLSMMDIESKKIWQSDVLPQLYPDENGRQWNR